MTRIRTFAIGLVGFAALSMVASQVLAHCGKCMADIKEMQKAMDAGKVTLASAIAAAEAHAKGKAVGATATWTGGKLGFTVHVMVGDKLQDVTVDATGKATKMEDSKVPADKVTMKKDVVKGMEGAKQNVTTAVTAAEAHSKGKAVSSVSTWEGGKLGFTVYALAGDKLQEVTVDATGKATGMKDAKAIP